MSEACLYECEPIAGHYRKFKDGPTYDAETMNTWQVRERGGVRWRERDREGWREGSKVERAEGREGGIVTG